MDYFVSTGDINPTASGKQQSFMNKRKDILVYLLLLIFTSGCKSGGEKPKADSFYQGTIHISADESFKPVIDSQVKVYESSHPDTKLIVHYKPEADCMRDLLVDSIRMVIITRKIADTEEDLILDSLDVVSSQMILAYDAVAVIVNPLSQDSLFTMDELKQIVKGSFNKNLIPVFDGLKATSTVRFIVDSLLRGDSLSSKAVAARSSDQVIDYVSRTPDAIGFIGVSWIGNKEDPQQQSFLTKVKLARVESRDITGNYIWPVQANIYAGRYPLTRDLVYILKENDRTGLGHGFANFMSGERGQLIFRRAYLVPGQMQFNIRSAQIRENE